MTNKDFLSQFSGENKKPDSFKEEERIPVTKQRKPVNVKLIVIILAAVLVIGGVVAFLLLRPTIEVKEFVGTNASEVKAWIKQNEIESQGIIFREEYNFDYDEGYITYQSIESGHKVRKNVKMDFVVSLGADPEELVSVPDIETMYKDELQAWVKENKLTKTKIMSAYSDEVESGAVISYEFKNGVDADSFKRSSTLNITVSKGPQPAGQVTVEDFKNKDYSSVELWAKQNKIELIKTTAYSDTVLKDSVISQSIEAKKTIKEGESLTVVVSLGKGIKVPDFSTMSNNDVDEWISDNKIKTNYMYSTSNSYVLEQTIASGKYFGVDDEFVLTLNKGNTFFYNDINEIIIPCAIGTGSYAKCHDIIENLEYMGLDIDAHKNEVDSDETRGTILDLKIHNGTTVYSVYDRLPLSVEITYNVSKGKMIEFKVGDYLDQNISKLQSDIASGTLENITISSNISSGIVKEIKYEGKKLTETTKLPIDAILVVTCE